MATEAEPPSTLSWYLGLFNLFEKVRLDMGVLTFDDLVPEAWARLVQYPALAKRYKDLYDAVLVDEFQDTNLSQVELLDILVRDHKNVMVCGDDDQGIFGFRKASNSFILGFAKRYGAVSYRISPKQERRQLQEQRDRRIPAVLKLRKRGTLRSNFVHTTGNLRCV